MLSEHDVCSRDLDVSIRSHDAGTWKSSEQIAGRALPWNLHATIVQFTVYACMYIYIERERYAAIDIGHVGDRISRTVESSSRG